MGWRYIPLISTLGVVFFGSYPAASAQSSGGIYSEYGENNSFWVAHEVVRGVIRKWDRQNENDYVFELRVVESLPGSFAYGQVLQGQHHPTSGSRFLIGGGYGGGGDPPEDLLSSFAIGDEMIVILKKEVLGPTGEVSLPDGSTRRYMMMPLKGRPLYRVKGEMDPIAIETLRICRATATARSLSDQVNAASTLLTEYPSSKRVARFVEEYLERVIGNAEKTLRYARAELAAAAKRVASERHDP